MLGYVPQLFQTVMRRLHQKDEAGHNVSAITGSETDEELREIATNIRRLCGGNCTSRECPFGLLHHLPPDSKQVTLEGMQRQDLLKLFEAEKIFRQEHYNPYK